jgi:hypothetical protein
MTGRYLAYGMKRRRGRKMGMNKIKIKRVKR